jgi:hypothetical protein
MEGAMRAQTTSPLTLLFRLGASGALLLSGLLVYSQSHLGIYQTADPDFLRWLKPLGITMVFHGILLFTTAFLGLTDRMEGIGISIIFNSIYFILLYQLFSQPEMAPVLAYNNDQAYLLEDSDFKHLLVRAVVGAVLLFIVVTVVGDIKQIYFLSAGKGRR